MQKHRLNFLRNAAMALLLALGSSAVASTGTNVVVVLPDGEEYSVAMADIEAIRFESGGFTLKAGDTDRYYTYSDVDRILIGADSSGINALASSGRLAIWPSPVETVLNVAGTEAGTDINVYSLSGVLVASCKSNGETVTIDLKDASAGTYIVKAGNRSVKIIKN